MTALALTPGARARAPTPALERVREVEQEQRTPTEVPKWGEGKAKLVHSAASAEEAAEFLEEKLNSLRVGK